MIFQLPEQLGFDFSSEKSRNIVEGADAKESYWTNISFALLDQVQNRKHKKLRELHEAILDSVEHIG
jgi:hypothetical protein